MKRRAESPPSINNEDMYEETMDDDDEVMSEVHLGCPPGFSGPHISHFTISIPSGVVPIGRRYNGDAYSACKMISLDEDGDLVLTRRSEQSCHILNVAIQHSITSTIPAVGLQVWRAELVLADFVLHKILTTSDFDGIVSLELGAGTGLVGMLLARVAKTVFLTDRGSEILDNCTKNVQLNSESLKYQASVYVRELDWEESWPPCLIAEESPTGKKSLDVVPMTWNGVPLTSNIGVWKPESHLSIRTMDGLWNKQRYSWNCSEVEEAWEASLLLAADVIYSDDLTNALFNTLKRLMAQGSEKVLYLALEKRYNFTLDDLNVIANGYSLFQSYLKNPENDGLEHETPPYFVGKQIDLACIPQYIQEYERGDNVEIWRIAYINKQYSSY